MREYITDDLISKLRVTKQLSFTKRGLVTRSFTEIIPDSIFNTMVKNNDTFIDIPDYVNFNSDLSTEAGGGVFVYDYERQMHDDNHEIICFNTSVATRFEYERDCDDKGIEKYFYIKQTLEDISIYHIHVHIKDPYSEGSVANIYIDDNIVVSIPLGSEDIDMGDPFTGVQYLDFPIGTVNKMDIVIVGNTNINARSEFTITFDSAPEVEYDDVDEEEVNEDA